ncbi:hypothetical protein B0A50_06343 [Salinomyces thailandicus]|uniref:Alpha/beta hydrolase fold-3 domain-containing protein n=1 Tax=Salinomyces thailandicus TaxID=706561 RepID=A0A4U0TR09_9PEZI|nr:hypothetical protein B0A50_06343 [Salinomyces thailandica]
MSAPQRGSPAAHAADQPSIHVTKRTDRSTPMLLLQHFLKPLSSTKATQLPKTHYPPGSPRLDPDKKAARLCEVVERRVNDIYIYDLLANKPAETAPGEPRRRKRLYYFAGGGWQIPASPEHWTLLTEMARRIPDTIPSLISTPLAPSSPAADTIPHLLTLYHTLLANAVDANEEVILAGDSSGGNIILCLTLAALHANPSSPAPIALMCISPSTDLTRTNPTIPQISKHDPLLTLPKITSSAKTWRGALAPTDPLVSPLYSEDIALLAQRDIKVHGVVGEYDILGPDAVLMREKCNEAGVKGEWLNWEKQMHCFPLTFGYGLKEGKEGLEWILDVLRRC